MVDVVPAEFSAVARRQVEAGLVASEEEAVTLALLDLAARFDALKTAIEEGLKDERHGKISDGRALMAELIARSNDLANG